MSFGWEVLFGPLLFRNTTVHHAMLCTGGTTSARVAVNDGIGYKAQGVDRLLRIAPVFPYGLVIFSRTRLHEVYRELPLCGLSVYNISSRKHLGAKLGIVCRLLLGLGQVSCVPQGLIHHVSPLRHDLFGINECSAFTVCVDMADDGVGGSTSLGNSLQISSTACWTLGRVGSCSTLALVFYTVISLVSFAAQLVS